MNGPTGHPRKEYSKSDTSYPSKLPFHVEIKWAGFGVGSRTLITPLV